MSTQTRFAALSNSAQIDTLDVSTTMAPEIKTDDESFNLASFDVTSFISIDLVMNILPFSSNQVLRLRH